MNNTNELHIEITRDDFANFHKYYFFKKGIKRRIYFVVLLSLLLPLYVGRDQPFHLFVYLITAIFCAIIYSLVFIVLMYFLTLWVKRQPSKNGSILGHKRFLLTDDGIREESESNTTEYKWNGIKSVESNEKYIFIFVDKMAGYIIPKRYFENEAEQITFIALIQSKIHQ